MSAQANPSPAPVIDQSFLLALLRRSGEKFLDSFAGMSDEQSRWKPAPDRWSVLDTVEHLTVAETLMVKIVATRQRRRAADAPNREEVFLERTADRGRKMEAPETSHPRGRFASLAEAAAQFKASREAAIRFVEQNTEDLRAFEVTHPHPAAGTVSVCEMLIIMAKHAERHAAQIEETRDALGRGLERKGLAVKQAGFKQVRVLENHGRS